MTAGLVDPHPLFALKFQEAFKICTATAGEMYEILQELKVLDDATADGGAEYLRRKQLLLETRARFFDELEDLDKILETADGRDGDSVVGHGGSSPVVGM